MLAGSLALANGHLPGEREAASATAPRSAAAAAA